MNTGCILTLTLACATVAHADFSYLQTRTSAGGPPPAGDTVTKHYLKGQKMKIETARASTIFDFGAQTTTFIDNQAKTYSVTPFADLGKSAAAAEISASVDMKETGQKKNVNGFNASQVVMTVAMQSQMSIELEIWISSDVPGAAELRAFYQRNGKHFPWSTLGGDGNPGMRKAFSDMQKRISSLGGVPVLQTTRMKSVGSDPRMAQAKARLEEMKKQGGQQAAMAEQTLARMSGGPGFEITMESSGFSTNAIPDSVFAVPGDYKKVTR
jgi:Domain of unknown function (DUF4412)